MFEKIPTAGIDKKEWLRLRKTGIGGSDAGAVCGLNPYSSPMNVYHDKTTDEVQETDSEAARIGHDLEDYVAKRFTEMAGLKVRKSNYMYRSLEHPFMIADVDRLIIGGDAGLECKTVSAYNADKWKDGDIPLHYVMQCYHYGSDIIGLNQKEPNSKGDAEFSPVLILSFRRYLMQGKESINLEQSQKSKKIKSIKVMYSNSHTDRPKISMEGKWLEQIGFQIGDRLAVSYGDGFIFISHHSADNSHPLAVHEPPADAYMAETDGLMDMGQAGGCRNRKDIKNKQIKVTSSMHVRQRAGYGGPFYYPERSKISMEGKWLEKAGFHIGDRVQVKYSENAICIYLAA